jgi:hypothetical protein
MRHSPADWDDHQGWDAYHREEAPPAPTAVPWRSLTAVRFVGVALAAPARRVWFPGCGLDLSPHVYARLGCDVLGTDVSATAVAWQEAQRGRRLTDLVEDSEDLQRATGAAPRAGHATFARHDFREALVEQAPFELILNVKAYQGLPDAAMRRAAAVFVAALAPGGQAYFDTVNVQGAERERIESSLEAAGFFIPFRKAERWYRERLDGTGLPYTMLLGRPRVDRHGRFAREARAAHAEETLGSFTAEYERRAESEQVEVAARAHDGRTKIAVVVYNTG